MGGGRGGERSVMLRRVVALPSATADDVISLAPRGVAAACCGSPSIWLQTFRVVHGVFIANISFCWAFRMVANDEYSLSRAVDFSRRK